MSFDEEESFDEEKVVNQRIALCALEKLGWHRNDIVNEMHLQGHQASASTLSRLATKKKNNIDVAGLTHLFLRELFKTTSGIALLAQERERLLREAFARLTGEDVSFEEALESARDDLEWGRRRMAQAQPPVDEDSRDERALDLAALASLDGQIELYSHKYGRALHEFLDAMSILPLARRSAPLSGARVLLVRAGVNALFAAWKIDEAAKRAVGQDAIAPDWAMHRVLKKITDPSFAAMARRVTEFLGDPRIAANMLDALAWEHKYRQAEDMLRLGLQLEGISIAAARDWKPSGWDDRIGQYKHLDPVLDLLESK
jgi:hypothetical protein